jgi:hypothetical protein
LGHDPAASYMASLSHHHHNYHQHHSSSAMTQLMIAQAGIDGRGGSSVPQHGTLLFTCNSRFQRTTVDTSEACVLIGDPQLPRLQKFHLPHLLLYCLFLCIGLSSLLKYLN